MNSDKLFLRHVMLHEFKKGITEKIKEIKLGNHLAPAYCPDLASSDFHLFHSLQTI